MKQWYCLNGEIDNLRVGIWIDGHFSWLDSEVWRCENSSEDEKEKKSLFTNKNISITIEPTLYEQSLLQEIKIVNYMSKKRDIKLFFSQRFTEDINNGVIFYAPSAKAIVCSYNKDYLLLNGMLKKQGIVQYCTDYKGCDSLNNGSIMMQPFSSRCSLSIFSLEGDIDANEELTAYFWLCKGSDDSTVLKENNIMQLVASNTHLNDNGCVKIAPTN